MARIGYHARVAVALMVLGCGGCTLLPADQYGNEARPFGVNAERLAYGKMIVREVGSREALIVACHDMVAEGDWFTYVSKDGLNCVRMYEHVPANSSTPSCEVLKVKDMPQDTDWVYAICNREWLPAEM